MTRCHLFCTAAGTQFSLCGNLEWPSSVLASIDHCCEQPPSGPVKIAVGADLVKRDVVLVSA